MHSHHVYILKKADGNFHTGVTKNLKRRLAEYQLGIFSNEKIAKMNFSEMWSYPFESSLEAILFQREIKDWPNAKMEKLLKDDNLVLSRKTVQEHRMSSRQLDHL